MVRQGAGSSPAIPSWNPNRACSSISASATPRRALRAATYFYHYRIDDLIERYSTQTDFFFFRNRGRARLRGFEAEAQAELGWGLHMESAFQVARGRALDDNIYLDDIAPETFSIQLRKTLPVRNAFAQIRTGIYAEDTRPGPTERVVPGYTMIDVGGGIADRRGVRTAGLGAQSLERVVPGQPGRAHRSRLPAGPSR